ncbi:hypothetical protein N8D56_20865 [Devosia sp. A8/3-2]|nr:hypothetical protein N8D56_20865 [Devosia sp. A8/3-2]
MTHEDRSNRQIMLERAALLLTTEPGFGRFFKAAIPATDGEDLGRRAPDAFRISVAAGLWAFADL